MNAVIEELNKHDYYVADLSQADWGRREIAIAETEMPGLISVRDEFQDEQLNDNYQLTCPAKHP